ncbi:MAG: hypothetical protein GY894_03715 [Planctomycetes bacterium]|jgi:hypothetical protein|nr:hypothetical protein [Planctomycetota bacterium]MCP4838456.1 hypothetical protein [Planctomycetota bacterium]
MRLKTPILNRRFRHIAVLGLVVSASIVSGCNIAGAVDALTRPDPVVEAQYELAAKPTVILFDDYRSSIVTPVRLRRDIAEEATIVLMENLDSQDMISPLDAMRLAQKLDKPGKQAAIHEIGKGVGAEQVIYVTPARFSIPAIAGTADPTAAFRVKVIDVETKARVWPDDDAGGATGWPIQVALSRDEAMSLSSDGRGAVSRALATKSGDEIARLFIDTHYSQHGNRLIGK